MLWSQRRNMGRREQKYRSKFMPLGRTSDLGIQRPRMLPLDSSAPPPFSRLLRHAGGYSGTILNPNPQFRIYLAIIQPHFLPLPPHLPPLSPFPSPPSYLPPLSLPCLLSLCLSLSLSLS